MNHRAGMTILLTSPSTDRHWPCKRHTHAASIITTTSASLRTTNALTSGTDINTASCRPLH